MIHVWRRDCSQANSDLQRLLPYQVVISALTFDGSHDLLVFLCLSFFLNLSPCILVYAFGFSAHLCCGEVFPCLCPEGHNKYTTNIAP